jgi:hypothetical protein
MKYTFSGIPFIRCSVVHLLYCGIHADTSLETLSYIFCRCKYSLCLRTEAQ